MSLSQVIGYEFGSAECYELGFAKHYDIISAINVAVRQLITMQSIS
ncbi:MAG: hypothetical protein IKT46_03710 [Clostridia bacterium]|nr:hypothetical protein [Clostridia bacterium]